MASLLSDFLQTWVPKARLYEFSASFSFRHVWKNALKQNVMEQGCVFVPHAGRKSVDQADASSEHLALEAFIALPSRK